MPALSPAEVSTSPFVDVERGRRPPRPRGKRAASSPAHAQWVVARRPSSRPAWARAKAPVQTESSRAPRPRGARAAPPAPRPGAGRRSRRSRGRRPSRPRRAPPGRPRASGEAGRRSPRPRRRASRSRSRTAARRRASRRRHEGLQRERRGRRRRRSRGRGRPHGAWQKSIEHWHSCLWMPTRAGRQHAGMQIALLIFDKLAAHDAVGPYEVMRNVPGWEVEFVATQKGEVRAEGGLGLIADRAIDEVDAGRRRPRPRRRGNRPMLADEEILAWLRAVDRGDEMDDLGLHRLAGARRRRPARGQAGDRELARASSRCATTAPSRSAAASSRTAR